MKRLAIVTTHPIQYNSPLFALLTSRRIIEVKVFFTWGESVIEKKYDPGFAQHIEWDIPLLDGFEYSFVENVANDKGSHHYSGINNPSLIGEIESWNPNAILVFGWKFKSHLGLIRHYKGKIPVVFRGDSTLIDEPSGVSIAKTLRRILLRWVYKHVDFCLYVGTANKKYFKAHGVQESYLVHVPHAVDNKRFEKPLFNVRERLKIPSEAFVFLYAGKMELKKNPSLLLNSFLSLERDDCHLLFCGDGLLTSELKSQVDVFPLEKRSKIHFVPFQNQQAMPSVYAAADVYVLPSQGPGETWGLSVNEAMAARKAVLVSDKCGCSYDLLKDGKNGYKFQSGNAEELLQKMMLLTLHRKTTKQMGMESWRIIQQYNYNVIAESIERVVETN